MSFFLEPHSIPRILAASVLLWAGALSRAEMFRSSSTKILELEGALDKKSVVCGVNDSVAVRLPKDRTFVQGVEISISVPEIVAQWRDSVAWSFYTGIDAMPDSKTVDYNATSAHTGTFGSSLSLNIRVPFQKGGRKDAYSVYVEKDVLNAGDFVFMRIQPIMKGVPPELFTSKFEVTASPILSNNGILTLSTEAPEGGRAKNFTVFVDGRQTEISALGLLLKAGAHDVSLVSDYYRNELRTVSIERAKTTELKVRFRDIKPTVAIVAPEGTKVFFDGSERRHGAEPLVTTPGEHSVKFVVGDWELVKALTVENGRSYTVSVALDATVTKEE